MLKPLVQSGHDLTSESEDELVVRAGLGEECAVRELVRRLNPRLFRIARGMLDSDAEAEEVVQETYLAAFTKLHTFRGDARFSTWVTRIAMNAARMRLRSARSFDNYDTVMERPGERASVVPFPRSEIERPEAAVSRREVRDVLESAVGSLPKELRVVFLMRESEGLSIGLIASDLQLNPITVKTRLFRARRRLRRILEAEFSGGFSSIFPFDGSRCSALTARVLAALEAHGTVDK